MSKQPVGIIAKRDFITPVAVQDRIRVLYGHRDIVYVELEKCHFEGEEKSDETVNAYHIYGEPDGNDYLTTLDEEGKYLS